MKKLGIDVTFVNPDASEEEISAAFRPNTKALFGETISNPTLEVLDIEKFARIAHSHGVPLIVDNTFPTPINCRPFEWGADIVVHSTTKYMDGHATSVGGAIVDSGNFDWDAHADKFPGLCTPDESYHGLTYTKAFGKMAYITKATAQLMRDLGSIQSPQNAFLLNLGLETLHLRMPQHCKNAQAVAEYLAQNDKVAWVNYCGLPGDKYYEQAQKYMPNGSCGVVTFGLKGGREESIKFMDSLEFIAIVTHVADARSCVLHPASLLFRRFQINAGGHKLLRKKQMAFIDFLGNLPAYGGQMKESIFIHGQKTAVLQNAYRMADTRFAKAHVPGKINRTNHALLLLEYQHSLQIILPGRMNLHRSLLLGGKLLFCVPHGSVLPILC